MSATTPGIVERVQAAVVEADPTTMMPLSAAVAAVRAIGDVLREAYDESTGWGLPLAGYDGCSDGCVACLSDWLRKVAE